MGSTQGSQVPTMVTPLVFTYLSWIFEANEIQHFHTLILWDDVIPQLGPIPSKKSCVINIF